MRSALLHPHLSCISLHFFALCFCTCIFFAFSFVFFCITWCIFSRLQFSRINSQGANRSLHHIFSDSCEGTAVSAVRNFPHRRRYSWESFEPFFSPSALPWPSRWAWAARPRLGISHDFTKMMDDLME